MAEVFNFTAETDIARIRTKNPDGNNQKGKWHISDRWLGRLFQIAAIYQRAVEGRVCTVEESTVGALNEVNPTAPIIA